MPEAATAPPRSSRRRRGLRLRTALFLVLVAALLLGGLSELRRRLAVQALMATLPKFVSVAGGPINDYEYDPTTYSDRRFEPSLRRVRQLRAERAAALALMSMLRDAREAHDEWATQRALAGLLWFGPEAKVAVPELILTADQTEFPFARNLAVHVLTLVGGDEPEVVRALVEALRERSSPRPDWITPQTAANELARLGPKAAAAVPALTRVVADGPHYVRFAAIAALGAIGKDARPAVPALLARLGDEDAGVRGTAAQTLGRIIFEPEQSLPPPELEAAVVKALRPLEDDPDEWPRAMAKRVLARIHTGHELVRRRLGRWQQVEAERRPDRARASSGPGKAGG